MSETLENELQEYRELVAQYHEDISELENKLTSAKEKKRLLAQRHRRATGKKRPRRKYVAATAATP